MQCSLGDNCISQTPSPPEHHRGSNRATAESSAWDAPRRSLRAASPRAPRAPRPASTPRRPHLPPAPGASRHSLCALGKRGRAKARRCGLSRGRPVASAGSGVWSVRFPVRRDLSGASAQENESTGGQKRQYDRPASFASTNHRGSALSQWGAAVPQARCLPSGAARQPIRCVLP